MEMEPSLIFAQGGFEAINVEVRYGPAVITGDGVMLPEHPLLPEMKVAI